MRLLKLTKYTHLIATLFLLLLFSQDAFAGPFRERIRERVKNRLSEKRQDKTTNKDNVPLDASLFSDGIKYEVNIPYGDDPKHLFDVYYPAHNVQNSPVIFMVHGGGWRNGNKSMKRVVVNKVNHWVPKGFIFISTNYRLVPDLDPIGQARDVVKALAKAQKEVRSWGGDPKKFILMGHSAGAHLVSLIATDLSLSQGIIKAPWLGVIALDSAAYNVESIMTKKHLSLYDKAFGSHTADYWRAASPFYAITPKTGPILAVYSARRKDATIQTKSFAKKAISLGVKVVSLGKNMGHGEINEILGEDKVYTREVEAFMAELHQDIKKILFDGTSGHP